MLVNEGENSSNSSGGRPNDDIFTYGLLGSSDQEGSEPQEDTGDYGNNSTSGITAGHRAVYKHDEHENEHGLQDLSRSGYNHKYNMR